MLWDLDGILIDALDALGDAKVDKRSTSEMLWKMLKSILIGTGTMWIQHSLRSSSSNDIDIKLGWILVSLTVAVELSFGGCSCFDHCLDWRRGRRCRVC
ncbi:hypothetical protein RchiOBHm_Chr4g0415751 [Rosa chinensis]|uniref:Uncharacterized protein n=1 Tax=Rosa chinensis TaxID=74649 RepID=A0A2P6QWM7_ROSCH|nr:hypothetical protein RchiOBHm_Chr4g0415751 [Rosa chinensis]